MKRADANHKASARFFVSEQSKSGLRPEVSRNVTGHVGCSVATEQPIRTYVFDDKLGRLDRCALISRFKGLFLFLFLPVVGVNLDEG